MATVTTSLDGEQLPHARRPFTPDGETGVLRVEATEPVLGGAGPSPEAGGVWTLLQLTAGPSLPGLQGPGLEASLARHTRSLNSH